MVLHLLLFPNFDLLFLIFKKVKGKKKKEKRLGRERLEKVGQTLDPVQWEPS